ncbi:MAG TPA: hypothetical protein VIH57_04520 [Bacteroidales bacterium]
MKVANRIFLVLLLVLLGSCGGEFIPDPIDPRLPKYTEEGNDAAGAFINEKIWKSVVSVDFMSVGDQPYITLFTAKDSLTILFEGNSSVYRYIEFRLSGLSIYRFEDLQLLNNKKIFLDGKKSSGVCHRNYCPPYESGYYSTGCPETGISGQLYIKNVAMRDSLTQAILSGTFGFTFNDPVSGINEVSYGRFDYRFGKGSNFIVN